MIFGAWLDARMKECTLRPPPPHRSAIGTWDSTSFSTATTFSCIDWKFGNHTFGEPIFIGNGAGVFYVED